MDDAPEIKHEAVARRRGDGFIATCTCGWYGHEVPRRREATRAALEHEMRAAQKRERLIRLALSQKETGSGAAGAEPAEERRS